MTTNDRDLELHGFGMGAYYTQKDTVKSIGEKLTFTAH
jgi:hypothetical protein